MEEIRTEETVQTPQEEKTYTEAQFNAKLDALLGKKLARQEAKLRREYDSRYDQRDIALLARAEAEEIIRGGYDGVVQEVDRLAALGMEKMTPREKQRFQALAQHRQEKDRSGQFSALGVTQDLQETRAFRDFVGLFQPDAPADRILELYRRTLPGADIRPMGTMKSNPPEDSVVKEFYTRDEALRFTKQDFDKNPALYRAVAASMGKW